jgi:hypothetical protein
MGFKIVEDRPTPKEVYNWRIYFIAVITSFGSVLFGYDTGAHQLGNELMKVSLVEQLPCPRSEMTLGLLGKIPTQSTFTQPM